MSEIRCGAWSVIAAVVLFDVAPSPSCGSGGRNEAAYLYVSAADCSCVTGVVRVSIDDRFAAEITCGGDGPAIVEVRSGSHVVTATSGSLTWPAQTQTTSPGRTTRVELGCPER